MAKKFKELSGLSKFAIICVFLSAITGFILGFLFFDDVTNAFGNLPFDVSGIFVAYLILYYSIDILIEFLLTRGNRWARTLAIWWGILALLTLVTSISNPSAMFVTYGLSVVAAVCLLIAKKDFQKETKSEKAE